MNWIYYFDSNWDAKGQARSGRIYFRPTKYNEDEIGRASCRERV